MTHIANAVDDNPLPMGHVSFIWRHMGIRSSIRSY
jgi:hypothetical protein